MKRFRPGIFLPSLLVLSWTACGGTESDDAAPADATSAQTEASETATEVRMLPFVGSDAQPGRYETGLLGVTVNFAVPDTMRLWLATDNRILFADTFTSEFPVTTRRLAFSRISGWNTREEAIDLAYLGDGSIEPDDVDAWIAANPLDVGPVTTETVAGREATVVDVRLQPEPSNLDSSCIDAESCAWAASVSGEASGGRPGGEPRLATGQVNRLWLVSIDGWDPLLIEASAAVDDTAWLDTVSTTTIATLELGADAPPSRPD